MLFRIDEVLKMDNSNSIVMEIDSHLTNKSVECSKTENLTEAEKIFLIVGNFEREIINGGFNQFYFNTSGNFAMETPAALKRIGAEKTAAIVEEANECFPGGKVPAEHETRQDILDEIEDDAEDDWDDCEGKFYRHEDDISKLLIEYVKKNISEFK